MEALANLIGTELRDLVHANRPMDDVGDFGRGVLDWEEHERDRILEDSTIPETEKRQIILARRRQGRFKVNVRRIERACRITGVDHPEHLRASHIKPWRDGRNQERLDGENGLLLTPSIDHLFDRGFISFENSGRLLISPVAHRESLAKMGVPEQADVGCFSNEQRASLDYHRNEVFLERSGGRQ